MRTYDSAQPREELVPVTRQRSPYEVMEASLAVGIPSFRQEQLLVRDKQYTATEHPAVYLCADAVGTSSGDFLTILQADESPFPLVVELQTAQESLEHSQRFASAVGDAIDHLHAEDPSDARPVTLVGMASGGFAPLAAVMEHLQTRDGSGPVQFVAIDHTYNPELHEPMLKGKKTIIVDDGLTTAISLINQAVMPYLLDEGERAFTGEVLDRMRTIYKESGTCNDPRLLEEYQTVMQICESKGVVLAPLYSRNRLLPQAFQAVAQGRDSAWIRAQRFITDEQVVAPIEEGVECVGASLSDLPCRDLGVSWGDLLANGLDPRIAEYMEAEGLGHVELRHLSSVSGLLQVTPQGQEVAIQLLAQRLNAIFMEQHS